MGEYKLIEIPKVKHPTYEFAEELVSYLPEGIKKHSYHVSDMTVIIGKQIQEANRKNFRIIIDDKDLESMRVGGLLHDIGRLVYSRENGIPGSLDKHEYATWRILDDHGYGEFGKICAAHVLGGLREEETEILGYPRPINLMPEHFYSKVICIADKVRPEIGVVGFLQKFKNYNKNDALYERYFSQMEGLLDLTKKRVWDLWRELERLGMHKPVVPVTGNYPRTYRDRILEEM